MTLPLWRRSLRALWQWPLALLILFEEWGWEPLQRLLAWIAQLPLLRQLEAWVQRRSPHAALALLVAPSLGLLPVKLSALWLLGHGHPVLGMSVILGAKLVGTALVARLFKLTQPALMQMPWFARLYARWTRWKDELLAKVRASWPWRLARVLKRQVQRRWHAAQAGWRRLWN